MSDMTEFFVFKYHVEDCELDVVQMEQSSVDNIDFDEAFYIPNGMYVVVLRTNEPLKAIECIRNHIDSTVSNLLKIKEQLDNIDGIE